MDLDGAGWDSFWRWEIFRRRLDPVDYLRWKSDSSRELRGLPQGQDRGGLPPLLLDSTCGLGSHAMAQRRLGFRVEACDASELALGFARERIAEEGLDIETFPARWETLGSTRPDRYDLVFNDEIHQLLRREDMLAALRGIRGALRPGGSFVFFFADAAKPENGPPHADWDWERGSAPREAWRASGGGLEVSLTIAPERASRTLILEHHLYRIREGGGPEREERVAMPRNYLWDWAHLAPVLEEAGFEALESHTYVNVKGGAYSMNLARRPL